MPTLLEPVAVESPLPRLDIDAQRYLGLAARPERIRERLDIAVSPHAVAPRVHDLRDDWVASVAVPAFKLLRLRQGLQQAFCSIGTGVGLDALAAVEILGATQVGLTDLHQEVVVTASANLLANVRAPHAVHIDAGAGDLFAPLRDLAQRYDLVYENLPNVPIDDAGRLGEATLCAGCLPPRPEPIPPLVRLQLLSLHYLALRQAHDFLTPGGVVLSALGCRIPLATCRELARLAGHRGEIYTYGWKRQVEAEAVIGGHAKQQRAGYGPFHFYRAEHLETVFSGVDTATSGEWAFEIEARLERVRLDPFQAGELLRRGEAVGHTVAVLRSEPE